MIDTNEVRRKLNAGYYADKDVAIGVLCDEIDRLRSVNYYNESAMSGARSLLTPVPGDSDVRGEKQTPPQGKTVDVRIPVSMSPRGDWMGCGSSAFDDQQAIGRCGHNPATDIIYWLTATLLAADEVEVVAKVEGE